LGNEHPLLPFQFFKRNIVVLAVAVTSATSPFCERTFLRAPLRRLIFSINFSRPVVVMNSCIKPQEVVKETEEMIANRNFPGKTSLLQN
jgi:hypothetical protein